MHPRAARLDEAFDVNAQCMASLFAVPAISVLFQCEIFILPPVYLMWIASAFYIEVRNLMIHIIHLNNIVLVLV